MELLQSQKMESIGRLAGGMAHDFNNILTAIGGYAGFLFRGLAEDDPRREDAKEILNAAERAAALTRQLLAFSRKQILAPQQIDINATLAGTVNMLRRLIGEDVKLEVKPAKRPCMVNVDPGQLSQVLMNLAVNARDAMPEGGTIVIEAGLVKPDKTFFAARPGLKPGPLVRLSFSDTGCGISPENKKHLFEPFFTTKEKGKGTGLGLATVYGIVKQSGGDIEVESAPGHGTTFHIYLPQVAEAAPGKEQAEGKIELQRGTETILLVDDEEPLRRLSERFLRAAGYTVISAADGLAAIAAAESYGKPVDLLLTDVVMPGMNGRELARRLADARLAARTLYMSGYTDEAVIKHGVLEPGIAFIYKPFSVEALTAKVREALDGPADKAKP
jgi:CheY-like chemotaxis protein